MQFEQHEEQHSTQEIIQEHKDGFKERANLVKTTSETKHTQVPHMDMRGGTKREVQNPRNQTSRPGTHSIRGHNNIEAHTQRREDRAPYSG